MKLSPLSALLCNERAKLVIAKARIPVIARTICVLFRLFCWQHDWHTSSLSSLECFVVLFWDYSTILVVWCYSVFSWILIWCVLTWYLFWCTVNLCYHAGLEKLRGQIATQIFLLLFWLAVRRGHLCDKKYRNLLFAPVSTPSSYCIVYRAILDTGTTRAASPIGHDWKNFRSRWRWAVRWWRKWCLTKAKIYLPQYISTPVSLLEW